MQLKRAKMTNEERLLEKQKDRERKRKNGIKVRIDSNKGKERTKKQSNMKILNGVKIRKPSKILSEAEFLRKKFFVIDSEGYTDKKGKAYLNLIGVYAILDNGTEYYKTLQGSMSTRKILDWIYAQVEEMQKGIQGDLEGLIFGSGYDFTMWLKDLTADEMRKVLDHVDENGVKKYSIGVLSNHIFISFIPGKFLSFNLYRHKAVTISDVMGITQASFVDSLIDLKIDVPKDELDRMAYEKTLRGQFSKEITPEVIAYNKQELIYLYKMGYAIKNALLELKWYPKLLYGVGAIGNYLLALHHIEDQEPYTPMLDSFELEDFRECLTAYEESYFGGYIYTFIIGTAFNPIYHYDLKSAYPYAMALLPPLKGGRWTKIENPSWDQINNASVVSIVKIQFDIPHKYPILPIRKKNSGIEYVSFGEWTYNVEVVKACHESGEVNITPKILWEFVPASSDNPFAYLHDIYNLKNQTDKHTQRVKYNMLKIGMNNEYGKEVQTLGGSVNEIPTYYNIVYGQAITGMTRAKLIRGFTKTGWDNAILAMTDSIFSTHPLPSDMIGDQMGDFEDESKKEGYIKRMTVIETGVYYYETDKMVEYKHRGWVISKHGKTLEEIDSNMKKDIKSEIKELDKWLKNPSKDYALRQRTKFHRLTLARSDAGYKKIGTWSTPIDGLDEEVRALSIKKYLKDHGKSLKEIEGKDLSKEYISLKAFDIGYVIRDMLRMKGMHATAWNKSLLNINGYDEILADQENMQKKREIDDDIREI